MISPPHETHPPENGVPAANQFGLNPPLARLFERVALEQLQDAAELLRRGVTTASLFALLNNARRRLDKTVASLPRADERACAVSCASCCYTTSIDMTPLEILVLGEHLKTTSTPEQLATIRRRLAVAVKRRQQLPLAGQQTTRLRCGLLNEQQQCDAYGLRPLACRGAFSFSARACQAALQGTAGCEETNDALDTSAKASTMGVFAAMQYALTEVGLDTNLYELNSALLMVLNTDDAFSRWMRGDDVFADCLCLDAHCPPRTAPLACGVGELPIAASNLSAR